MLLRYVRPVRSLKWSSWIRPEYADDYKTHRMLKSAFKDSRKKENKEKILVFESLNVHRIISKEELSSIDTAQCSKQFSILRVFFAIHDLEGKLSGSVIPFTDLTDELDEILEDFCKGSDEETLKEPMNRLLRRIARRRAQAIISAASAATALLLSIYWLIDPCLQTAFNDTVTKYGIAALAFCWTFTYTVVWRSFPSLLPRKEKLDRGHVK
jgi:hypothetical protein